MRLITCHIGCISPRRQARKRRTLQTSKTYFAMFVPVRKHQFDFSYGLCEPCSLSLCVDRRDLRSMQCAIPRGAPTLQSSHKRKQPSTAMPLCGTTSSPFSFVAARVAPMGTAPMAPLGGQQHMKRDMPLCGTTSSFTHTQQK